MIQDVFIRYNAGTGDLEKADDLLESNAKNAGLAEDEVKDYNKQLNNTQKQIKALQKEAKVLENILEKTTDPDEVKEYNSELAKVNRRIRNLQN